MSEIGLQRQQLLQRKKEFELSQALATRELEQKKLEAEARLKAIYDELDMKQRIAEMEIQAAAERNALDNKTRIQIGEAANKSREYIEALKNALMGKVRDAQEAYYRSGTILREAQTKSKEADTEKAIAETELAKARTEDVKKGKTSSSSAPRDYSQKTNAELEKILDDAKNYIRDKYFQLFKSDGTPMPTPDQITAEAIASNLSAKSAFDELSRRKANSEAQTEELSQSSFSIDKLNSFTDPNQLIDWLGAFPMQLQNKRLR
jgi:hypothetical protein